MLGHLVPCSGGKSIPLRRERVYLGRRPHSDKSLPLGAETAICRLRRSRGWWHADDLGLGIVRVNGDAHQSLQLKPRDELTIGRMRFRILYEAPEEQMQDAEVIAEAVLSEQPPPQALVNPQDAVPGPNDAITKPAWRIDDQHRDSIRFQPARLVPLGGGPDFLVSQQKVTIGRKENCDIVLPFATVSSMHCGLEFVDGYWQVLDLGSRNGIRVDGVRCERAWVYPESRVSIADRRFELDYVPQGERPEPDPASIYSKPLMETLGISREQMDKALVRHREDDQDEPQRKRYDLLDNL
jgi:FHA domain